MSTWRVQSSRERLKRQTAKRAGSAHGRTPMDVPSPDELQRLLKLTGSEDAVVRMLARQWGLSPVVIATTVKGWSRVEGWLHSI